MSSSTSGKTKDLSRVFFDVGGKIFWTKPETLEGSGKLKKLYQDKLRHRHRDGTVDGQSASNPIRIDRDWTEFKEILGYLRDPRYPIDAAWEYALQFWDISYEGLFEDVDSSDDDSDCSVDTDVDDDEIEDDIEDDDDEDFAVLVKKDEEKRGRSRERRPAPANKK